MMIEPLLLSEIKNKTVDVSIGLTEQLASSGFAIIKIDIDERATSLRLGIKEISGHHGFRFPPINVDQIIYQAVHREAFRSLFETGIDLLSILTGKDERSTAGIEHLFKDSLNEPFSSNHEYHPTFFNLFNYDHGALNPHQDRGLLTVIHVSPAPVSSCGASIETSALWIEGSDQIWRSGDQMIRECLQSDPDAIYVVMLIGEEGESLKTDFYAAEHSVRVQPKGSFIERSHHRRDPESRPNDNRKSAALILRRRSTLID